jgi:DNA-binding response OmpR family regulator
MRASALPDPHPRVLIVDPDADTLGLYEQAFMMAGFDVVQATDGREALTKALVRPPSLIVMELRLPLIDGGAVCEILRQDRATAGIPILVVTADARSVELERIRAVGANDALLKPVHADLLVQRASQLMAQPGKAVVSDSDGRTPSRRGSGESFPTMKRRTRVGTTRRELTTSPPLVAPTLSCPSCDRALTYVVSHTGGVNDRHPEQWDYFSCSACGAFQYRHRTRKLRRLDALEQEWLQRQRAGSV